MFFGLFRHGIRGQGGGIFLRQRQEGAASAPDILPERKKCMMPRSCMEMTDILYDERRGIRIVLSGMIVPPPVLDIYKGI